MPMLRFGMVMCLALMLSCCVYFVKQDTTPNVADRYGYAQLIRLLPDVMRAQGLVDEAMRYEDAGSPGRLGEVMYKRLSPDFLYDQEGHEVYLGENFHRTLTPKSHVYPDSDGMGFAIVHPSQKFSMRLLAVADWNKDGRRDWIMRCTVETFKGSRIRHYYVLAPEPDPLQPEEMTHGTILASVDERSLASPVITLRDISGYGREDDQIPPTEVHDALPGEVRVTEAPSRPAGRTDVEESSL